MRIIFVSSILLLLTGCHQTNNNLSEGVLKNDESVQKENHVISNTMVNKDLILTRSEIDRNNYETEQYVSIGEPILIKDSNHNEDIWKTTLKSYDIMDDTEGLKKILVLNFEHSYLNNEFATHLSDANPLEPTVFYQDINLIEQSWMNSISFVDQGGDYENSGYLFYSPTEIVDQYVCKKSYFNVGDTFSCYTYYNYVGPGNYLVSFNDGQGNLLNYVIDIQ